MEHQPIENARDYYYDIEGKVPIKKLNDYVLWNKKDTGSQRKGNASFMSQMGEINVLLAAAAMNFKRRITLSVGVPPTELTILFGWWDTNQ